MSIAIDAKKGLDKTHHPFVIKICNEFGIEGNFLNLTVST